MTGPPENDAAPGSGENNGAGDNDSSVAANSTPLVQVTQFLHLIIQPGAVFEVRALKCRNKPGQRSGYWGTVVGYFTHGTIAHAAQQILALDAAGVAPGIYITLNPIQADLLARSANVLQSAAEHAVEDAHVLRRHWALVDCDPVRAQGVSSTDRELEASRLRAEQVRLYLTSLGWPDPIIVMSGNGYHLLYAIDLPGDDNGLVNGVLKALSARFSDGAAVIDTSVGNSARISKVAGTMVRKGSNAVGIGIEDRPHRRACIASIPESIVRVPRELLEGVAAELPTPASRPASGESGAKVAGRPEAKPSGRDKFERFDHTPDGVRGYLSKFGINVTGEKRDGTRTYLFLDRCPVVADCAAEGKSDIAVPVGDDGVIGYKNLHNRGTGLGWLDVREALEPGYRSHASASKEAHSGQTKCATMVAGLRIAALGVRPDGRLLVRVTNAEDKEIVLDAVDQVVSGSRSRIIKAISGEASLDDADRRAIDAALRQLEPPPPGPLVEISPDDARDRRDTKSKELLSKTPPDALAEAEAMLLDPKLIDRIVADLVTIGIVGETVLGLTVYIVGTSRLLDRPLSAKVQGTSSSGKSFIVTRTGTLFPDESVLIATDLTSNSLYYMEFGLLIHTFVLAGERPRKEDDEHAESKRALREMISEGNLRKVLPIKQPEGGFISETIFQPGPIAHIESTTSTQIFDEDANRTILLSTDESPEQTAKIIMAAAVHAEQLPAGADAVVERHKALQRMLKRVRVRVPYARALAKRMPPSRPQARRAFNQLIAVIKAVALLHQRQRKAGLLNNGDVIDATFDDYAIAQRLLSEPFGQSLGSSLPAAVARFGRRLAGHFRQDVFSSTDAKASDEVIDSKGKINEYLRALVSASVLEVVDENRGAKPKTYRFLGPVPEGGVTWLPTIEQLEEGLS